MRLVQEVALYGDNTLAKKLTSLDTQLSVTKGEIDAIISSSELTELRNGSSTMYSLLNSVKSDVSGTKQQLSEVLTKYDATSKQYTEMSTKLNQLSTSVNGNTASVSELKTSLGQTDQRVSTVTQTASGLTSTVSAIRSSLANDYSTTTQVSSMISQSADAIRLKADKIAWASKYSSMTEDGKLTCTSGTFAGSIKSSAGTIGGWSISGDQLSSKNSKGNEVFLRNGGNSSQDVLVVKAGNTYPYWLRADGSFHAEKATISGTFTSQSGRRKSTVDSGYTNYYYNGTKIGSVGADSLNESLGTFDIYSPYDVYIDAGSNTCARFSDSSLDNSGVRGNALFGTGVFKKIQTQEIQSKRYFAVDSSGVIHATLTMRNVTIGGNKVSIIGGVICAN